MIIRDGRQSGSLGSGHPVRQAPVQTACTRRLRHVHRLPSVLPPGRWLSARQVADAIGVHVNTVKRADPGTLPFYRFNDRGDRRYRREDVVAFLRSSRVS